MVRCGSCTCVAAVRAPGMESLLFYFCSQLRLKLAASESLVRAPCAERCPMAGTLRVDALWAGGGSYSLSYRTPVVAFHSHMR